jgi:hypothetical protein
MSNRPQSFNKPVITVAKAAYRDQNKASSAMTLVIEGFCSSGILGLEGLEGICTKLKYQSNPTHTMADKTDSHRMKNVSQAWVNSRPGFTTAMMSIKKTKPAMMVYKSD